MANIPVGSRLSVTEFVPLPTPRPNFPVENDHTGSWVRTEITDIPDIFSWKESVGVERMKEQFSYYILEPLSHLSRGIEDTVTRINTEDLIISLIGLAVLGTVISIAINIYKR